MFSCSIAFIYINKGYLFHTIETKAFNMLIISAEDALDLTLVNSESTSTSSSVWAEDPPLIRCETN